MEQVAQGVYGSLSWHALELQCPCSGGAKVTEKLHDRKRLGTSGHQMTEHEPACTQMAKKANDLHQK